LPRRKTHWRIRGNGLLQFAGKVRGGTGDRKPCLF
jgi:hypothetical protein